MYTKFIPKNIQEKLKARERALSYKESGVNESLSPGDSTVKAIKPNEIQSRSVFVRMCSNKASVDNIVISGGKLDDLDGKLRFGIDNLYEDKKNSGRRTPVAGIKNIEVSYKGSYKAIREATVNWTVGSLDELDELSPYFLTPGKTVILDWGWVNKNSKSFSQNFDAAPFISLIQNEDLSGGIKKYVVDQNIFTNAQARVQEMGGDYDAIGGKISNFESTMRADGGFDCVTKITALGSTLFSKPIDKPTDQISIIPKPKKTDEEEVESQQNEGEKEEDKKSVKTEKGTDNLINAIINLKQIIIKKVFNWTGKEPKLRKEGAPQAFEANHSVYLPEDQNFGIAVDDPKNPQVCWMNRSDEEDFFVKWGWMEDQLMNRYLAFDAGKDKGAGIKITFRSIKTKIDGEGKPIPKKNKLDNQPTGTGTVLRDTSTAGGNPGYPFTTENYTKPDSAVRRLALAQKAGYNTYEEYKLKPFAERKALWDNSTELWSITATTAPNTTEPLSDTIDVNIVENEEPNFIPSYATGGYGQGEGVYLPEYQQEKDMSLNYDALFEENYGGTISYFDNISSIHAHEFEKEPNTIKNNKSLLYPINPFTFWSQELLPTEDRITGGEFMKTKNKDKYVPFHNAWKTDSILSKGTFTPKTEKGDYIEHLGELRNMWVNIKEIQKAFGIDLDNESQSKANPPGTFERGIESLLVSLNKNFYGIWDFELAVDPYDSTNMGVLDKKVNSIEGDSLKYTTFKNDEIEDKEGKKSHVVQDAGIYKFPSFKVGSIVKNQNLSFKIPDSMALTILYGSNKPGSKTTNNASFNNPDIMKLFNNNDDPKFEDMFLKDMMPANVSKDEKATAQNVGSIKTHPNSKIIKGEGVSLSGLEPWMKEWTGEDGNISEGENDSKTFAKRKYVFSKESDDIILLAEQTEDFERELGGNVGTLTESLVTNKTRDKFEVSTESPDYYRFNGNTKSLKLIDGIAKLIRSRLNGSIKSENQKSLKVDTIIPAELTLEVDGIGGMVPGDVIHTSYIQEKYGANLLSGGVSLGPYTYFQIFGLNQKVDASGWTTELTTKMRINHIPDKGDLRVEEDYVGEPLPDVPYPNIPVPTDDEDIADDVTLDDLDFDNFEEWDAPPLKPVKTTTKISGTGIGHGNPKLQKIVQRVIPTKRFETSVVENQTVEVTVGNIPPDPIARPKIPVPIDDEDIVELSPEEIKELQDYNPEFDDFDPWNEPPPPVKKPVLPKSLPNISNSMPIRIINRRMQEIENGNARRTKSIPPPPSPKTTYVGSFNQNSKILYSSKYKPEWRPKYKWSDGKVRNYTIQRDKNGIQLNYLDQPQSDNYPIIIRPVRDKAERQAYWDENIEPPTQGGMSKLPYGRTSPI